MKVLGYSCQCSNRRWEDFPAGISQNNFIKARSVCVRMRERPCIYKTGQNIFVYNVNVLWLTWGQDITSLIGFTNYGKKYSMIQHGFPYYLKTSARRPCIFHQDLKTRHRKGGSGEFNLHCKHCDRSSSSFRNSTATSQPVPTFKQHL